MKKMIAIAIVYFIVIIIIAHFFAPPEYNWTQNTVSDLAAQGLKYQWIMQAGFIGFGFTRLISALFKNLSPPKKFLTLIY